MTAQYVLHFGKNRLLSLMEAEAVLGEKPTDLGEGVLIETLPEDPVLFLNGLGGSVKISRKITAGNIHARGTVTPQNIAKTLLTLKPEGKLNFGLNLMPENRKSLDALLRKVKKALKTSGRNARFLNQGGNNLPSATIVKAGLLKDGTDFNLIQTPQGPILTQTIAVQDFEAYGERDYRKPARLAKDGMLPPKLAQIMINLAHLVTGPAPFTGKTLYDPFCGSGTVLGEALLKGMNAIGSDLSPEAMDAARTNLAWIGKTFHTHGKQTLFTQDARSLTKADLPKPPDLVITETHLGPPRSAVLSPDKIHDIYRDLFPLYSDFLKAVHPLLRTATPLVIAFPIYHTEKGPMPLPDLIERILPIGYKLHQRLTYHRKDQVVGRDILVLETR